MTVTIGVRVDLMDGRQCVGRIVRDDVRTVTSPRAGELFAMAGRFERALLGPEPRRIHQIEHLAGVGPDDAPCLVVVLREAMAADEVPSLRAEAERAGWTFQRLLRPATRLSI